MTESTGKKNKKSFEDTVITLAILIGLGGGVWLLFLRNSGMYTASAIFFGLALTAFTHRFLGGIDNNTNFTIGTLKVTGTIAVLLGSFWLINNSLKESIAEGPQGFMLPAAIQQGNVFFFDEKGEPLEFTFENDGADPLVVPKVPANKFKTTARELSIESGQTFVKAKDSDIYLGVIDQDLSEISDQFLTARQNLSLGMYYSQVTDKKTSPQTRRDANQAIHYLRKVLQGKNTDSVIRLQALNQMYFLTQYLKKAADFELVLSSLQELKHGYQMHLELGGVYIAYANTSAAEPTLQRKKALLQYLKSLSRTPRLDDKKNKSVISIVKTLLNVYLSSRDEYFRREAKNILRSIDRNDRRKLNEYISAIESSLG